MAVDAGQIPWWLPNAISRMARSYIPSFIKLLGPEGSSFTDSDQDIYQSARSAPKFYPHGLAGSKQTFDLGFASSPFRNGKQLFLLLFLLLLSPSLSLSFEMAQDKSGISHISSLHRYGLQQGTMQNGEQDLPYLFSPSLRPTTTTKCTVQW